jgi:hypothetical protein
MDMWQRGESFAFAGAASTYTADGFMFITEAANSSVERSADVPPGVPVTSSLKFTSGGGWSILRQYYEPPMPGTVLTLSAWVKGPAGTPAHMDIHDTNIRHFVFTGDWQFVSTTTPVPPDTGYSVSFDVLNLIDAGTFYAAAVTASLGNEPQPYIPQSRVQLLEDCRYRYVKLPANSHFGGFIPHNGAVLFPMPYTMRTAPALINGGMSVCDKWGNVIDGFTFSGLLLGHQVFVYAGKASHNLTEAWLHIEADSALFADM